MFHSSRTNELIEYHLHRATFPSRSFFQRRSLKNFQVIVRARNVDAVETIDKYIDIYLWLKPASAFRKSSLASRLLMTLCFFALR
jgi:hypothetical protein